jgi:hypothetical protein
MTPTPTNLRQRGSARSFATMPSAYQIVSPLSVSRSSGAAPVSSKSSSVSMLPEAARGTR